MPRYEPDPDQRRRVEDREREDHHPADEVELQREDHQHDRGDRKGHATAHGPDHPPRRRRERRVVRPGEREREDHHGHQRRHQRHVRQQRVRLADRHLAHSVRDEHAGRRRKRIEHHHAPSQSLAIPLEHACRSTSARPRSCAGPTTYRVAFRRDAAAWFTSQSMTAAGSSARSMRPGRLADDASGGDEGSLDRAGS
jgi:hypothetical protein